jgi:agmatine deiminase
MQTHVPTPASLGYRMPAEWEPHQGTWLSWPHNRATWPGKFESVEPVMVKAVQALCSSETVHINVLNAQHEAHVRRLFNKAGGCGPIQFHYFPTNDAWCRDHGALFVVRRVDGKQEMAAVDCRYNAWGGKYPPYDLDDVIPKRMAEALGIPCFEADMVLEGGSIDVNGRGLLLTTEQCLLNPNRNPHLSRMEIEERLCGIFGVERILWLGRGIAGDDTDGHIDDLARFVREDTVVTIVESNQDDENFKPLQQDLERLRAMTLLDGRPLHVLTLPMPSPLYYQGQRLPASYANFYIANEIVLLPHFNDPNDSIATHVLRSCFPTREIIGIDCTDLVWGLGAFHCLTQQIPKVAA